MIKTLKHLLLPVLAVFYPLIFLYSHNARIIELNSLNQPLLMGLVFALVLFGLFFLFQRKLLAASLSAAIFMAFFYSYGPLFRFLVKLNRIPIEHYTLLPVVIIIACYAGYFASKIKPKTAESLQNILLLVLVVLIGYNVATAVPVEIQKAQLHRSKQTVQAAAEVTSKKYPDIYFIVFDEYAGPDAIKEYWHDNYIDAFHTFLEQKGFFVADHSRSSSITSLIEIASRLNFAQYTVKTAPELGFYKLITTNKIMPLLKSYGYKTVVFNGLKEGYPAIPSFQDADYEYESAPKGSESSGLMLDDYQQLVLNDTMLIPFTNFLKANDSETAKLRDMLFFELKRTGDLSDIQSPKFVYTHFLFPHLPIMFNENGAPLDPKYRSNWNYYLGQHKYATKLAETLVSEILKNADKNNPPVIILQSDHGARNLKSMIDTPGSANLTNYPEKYQKYILNALYLPGYDYSKLTDNMDPIDALPTALNFYLNAGITVDRSAVKK